MSVCEATSRAPSDETGSCVGFGCTKLGSLIIGARRPWILEELWIWRSAPTCIPVSTNPTVSWLCARSVYITFVPAVIRSVMNGFLQSHLRASALRLRSVSLIAALRLFFFLLYHHHGQWSCSCSFVQSSKFSPWSQPQPVSVYILLFCWFALSVVRTVLQRWIGSLVFRFHITQCSYIWSSLSLFWKFS